MLKEIVLIGHGNGTYCKAYESFYELNDENTEYSKCLGFKVIKKIIKHYLHGFLKQIRLQ